MNLGYRISTFEAINLGDVEIVKHCMTSFPSTKASKMQYLRLSAQKGKLELVKYFVETENIPIDEEIIKIAKYSWNEDVKDYIEEKSHFDSLERAEEIYSEV